MRMPESTPRTGTGVARSGKASTLTHNPAPSTERGKRRAARREAARKAATEEATTDNE